MIKKVLLNPVVLLSLVIIIGLFPALSKAYEDQWSFVKYSEGLFCYYDPETISHQPDNHVKVWMKFLPIQGSDSYTQISTDLKKHGIEKDFLYIQMLYEIDCSQNTVTQLETVCFDRNRETIDTINMGSPPSHRITLPASLIEAAKKTVCK